VDLFLGDLPRRREALGHALSDGDAEGIREAAHALNGSAAYIGAVELARLCRELEGGAGSGDATMAARIGAALEAEAERVTRYLFIQRRAAQP